MSKKSVINQSDLHKQKSSGRSKYFGQFVIALVRTIGSTIRGLFKGKDKSFKFRYSETIKDEEGKICRQKEIEIDYNRKE
jgi:hypothetical protein